MKHSVWKCGVKRVLEGRGVVRAWMFLFFCVMGLGQWNEVRGALLDRVEVHARALAETGNWKEAMGEVREALKRENSPTEKAVLHELMGDLKVRQGLTSQEGSVEDYTAALALDPQNGRLFFKRGQAAFPQTALREMALNDLVSSLKCGYTNADTFYMMGSACKLSAESMTNVDAAARSYLLAYRLYQQALVVDTNHVAAMGNLGDMAYNFGRHDEAADYYRRVLSYRLGHQQTITCKARLAHVEMELKHFEEALVLLREADQLYGRIPAPADTMSMLGWHLEGLRILGYKMEALKTWGKKEEALAASRALLERVAAVKPLFDQAGATAAPLTGWEGRARELLKE